MAVARLSVAGTFRNHLRLALNGPRRETGHCRCHQKGGSGE